jgi:hypothetical protein
VLVVVTGNGYFGIASKKSSVRLSLVLSSVPGRKQFELDFLGPFELIYSKWPVHIKVGSRLVRSVDVGLEESPQ